MSRDELLYGQHPIIVPDTFQTLYPTTFSSRNQAYKTVMTTKQRLPTQSLIRQL